MKSFTIRLCFVYSFDFNQFINNTYLLNITGILQMHFRILKCLYAHISYIYGEFCPLYLFGSLPFICLVKNYDPRCNRAY